LPEKKAKGFAVWLTGIPGAGKSTIASYLSTELREMDRRVQVLDSDELRRILTPNPTYSEEERERFYDILAFLGKLLVDNGINVIIAATANKREYRDKARRQIEKFYEVYIDCPVKICAERDPKGLYQKAKSGGISTLPGLQTDYEPPEKPDVVIASDKEDPNSAVRKIIAVLLN
jgi:adenylylsulfate kinase